MDYRKGLSIAEGHPATKTLKNFLIKEGPQGTGRVEGYSIECDGVFIYCPSHVWCDDSGAGTFREDSETAAVRSFYERGAEGNGDEENPQQKRMVEAWAAMAAKQGEKP